MKDLTLIKIGSIGTLVAGVCCITPRRRGLIRDRSE